MRARRMTDFEFSRGLPGRRGRTSKRWNVFTVSLVETAAAWRTAELRFGESLRQFHAMHALPTSNQCDSIVRRAVAEMDCLPRLVAIKAAASAQLPNRRLCGDWPQKRLLRRPRLVSDSELVQGNPLCIISNRMPA